MGKDLHRVSMPTEKSCTYLNNYICKFKEVLSFSWPSLRVGRVPRPWSSVSVSSTDETSSLKLCCFTWKAAFPGEVEPSSHHQGTTQPDAPIIFLASKYFPLVHLAWIFATWGIMGDSEHPFCLLIQRWAGAAVCMWLPSNFQGLLLPLGLVAFPLAWEPFASLFP